MTLQPDDGDLAERFARLRKAERETTPPFAQISERRERPQSHRGPFALGLAAAVMAAAIIGVLVQRGRPRPEAPAPLDLRTARWTAPTDFLLKVPGSWLLRDVPQIAEPPSLQFDATTYRRIS